MAINELLWTQLLAAYLLGMYILCDEDIEYAIVIINRAFDDLSTQVSRWNRRCQSEHTRITVRSLFWPL